jgi:signal transduction histidine kinase
MFLKRISALWRTTSFRLAFGVSVLFSLSSLIFFASVYAYFFNSLRETDRTLIQSKLKQYSIIFQEQGAEGLRKLFSDDSNLNSEARFLVHIQNLNGDPIFYRPADDLHEFDLESLQKSLTSHAGLNGWSYIGALKDEDQLEILTADLDGQGKIQVAKSTSERQDFLERATEVFAIATFLSLLIGALGGYWFSNRTLRPLRDLVQTTQMISKENLNQRVNDTGSGDEFSELVQVFNSMLDRIRDLVGGMQDSLDSIAHDLKTPMTRLKAVADLALTRPNISPEESKSALQECSENSQEILTLLNSLMDIFEADSGAMKLHFENFQLRDVISEVFDLYEIVADEKQITLTNLIPTGETVYADRLRIKQVTANLIDNAIKYSPPNRSVSVNMIATKEGFVVSIQDEGVGILADETSRIWERLYRGTQVRSQPGAGLGLSLVSAIMKAHGGKAWVESRLPEGSEFKILIPKVRPAALLPVPGM